MPAVRENILENIRTTLTGITIANGYENTLASVQRWRQDGNQTAEIPFAIVKSLPENKTVGPNPMVTCRLTVWVLVATRQDEDAVGSTETVLNSLTTDVEKALMVDVTRGGQARDTNILGIEPFDEVEGQPAAGVIIELEVNYQHLQTDPTVSG